MTIREIVLVSAPNSAGEQFMMQLRQRRIPFAAIVNNPEEYERVSALGPDSIIAVHTAKEESWRIPPFEIGNVILFEKSLTLCCRYAQICRSWTSRPIYVVTGSVQPRHVYKALGVDYVIHSQGHDLSFLIDAVK